MSGKAVGFDENFLAYFNLLQSWTGKHVSLETALKTSVAVACGRVISEGLAMLPWKVMRRSGRDILPAVEHPLYDKLASRPNSLQSAFEFKEQVGLHLAFCGNSYVYAPRVSMRVDELYALEPRWVTTDYKWPEPPKYLIITDAGPMTLGPDEIWQIRGPSWCTYLGMEFVTIARQALGLSAAIEESQARLQGHGVQMPGYLSVDGKVTPEQHKKLAAWIEKEHSGSANSGRPMILDNAAKWISTAMSNVDAQTLEQRKFQIEEVCRFMRVLPIMVGHADKTASYASSEQMFLAHATYTLGPWATRLESSIDRWLLSDADRKAGYYVNLDEKALLRMTAKDQMEFLARGVLSGIIVRNEGRAKLDMNPIDGLDEPLAPANTFVGNPPSGAKDPTDPPADDAT